MSRECKNKRLNPQQRKLCEAHVRHAVAIAAKYCRDRGMTHCFDDIKASAWFGLVDAAFLFDERRGVKFSTFLRRRVLGQIVEDIRVRPKSKQPYGGIGSIDAMQTNDRDEWQETIGRESNAEQRLADESEVSKLLSKLRPREQFAYRMYHGHGYTMDQIGKAIGICGSAVCHMLARTQKQLEATHAR